MYKLVCFTVHTLVLVTATQRVSTEKDKDRTQRHHDELVIAINAGKDELREKRKERGAAADANRKAGYITSSTPCFHLHVHAELAYAPASSACQTAFIMCGGLSTVYPVTMRAIPQLGPCSESPKHVLQGPARLPAEESF